MKEPVTVFRLSNSLPENYRKADPVSLKALRVASDTLYFHVSQKGLPPVLIRTDTTGKATGAVVPGPGLNIIAFDADENGLVYLQEMKRSPGAAIFPFLTYAAGGSVVASRDLTTPFSTVARTASGTWTASNGKLVSLENPAGAIDIPSTARWVKVLPFSGNRVVVTDGALAKIWVITPATRDLNEIALSGPEIDEARRSADGMGLPPGQTALIVNDLTTSPDGMIYASMSFHTSEVGAVIYEIDEKGRTVRNMRLRLPPLQGNELMSPAFIGAATKNLIIADPRGMVAVYPR